MNLGICVGHSRVGGDRGAISLWDESEWNYNSKVAVSLKAELDRRGIDYERVGHKLVNVLVTHGTLLAEDATGAESR